MEAKLRICAAAVILGVMVWLGVEMLPPYLDNYRFQRYLEAFTGRPENASLTPDRIAAAVAERASRMGIPIETSQVSVRRSDSGLGIEIRYRVPVDLVVYTVDLHFRPSAGVR